MADTKSSFLIGISGVILSIIVPMKKICFSSGKLYTIYLAVFLLMLSTISQLFVIYPRNNVNEKNTLHYKGILKFNKDEYLKYLKEASSERIVTNYMQSIYDLAIIQNAKYKWLKFGLITLILAIFFISISIFL
jgi:hypothetical protein